MAVLIIRKILVPLVSADTSRHVVRRAAWLARRFRAELLLLHVLTPLSYLAGLMEGGDEMTVRDWHTRAVQHAQEDLNRVMGPELDGIVSTSLLLRGDPAAEIVKTARDQGADLIVMSTRGEGAYGFLLGSVTAKVLHESHCPVWTGAHLEEEADGAQMGIRRVLCAVNLSPHSFHTASLAVEMAAAFGAALTLVNVTSSVEIWGPGGTHVDPAWKEAVVGAATDGMITLREQLSSDVDFVIDSGSIPQALNRVAAQTGADVLVLGHIPGRSHLGDNGEGYGIIRESLIPVLSV